MKYIATIEFKEERHCLHCPIRDEATDGCKLQVEDLDGLTWPKEFENWEEQMKECPLERVSEG